MPMPTICPMVKSTSEVKETHNPIRDNCPITELCMHVRVLVHVCACVHVCVCARARVCACVCVLTAADGSHIAIITITAVNIICKRAVKELLASHSSNTTAIQVRDDGGLIAATRGWINAAAGWKDQKGHSQ